MAGLFISPSDCRWESNLTAEHRLGRRLRQATFCGEAAVDEGGALIDPQLCRSVFSQSEPTSPAHPVGQGSALGRRPRRPVSKTKQQTMTNFFPSALAFAGHILRSGEPHVMLATKMFWLFPPSDQILAFHQRLPPTSPRWTTLTSIEYRYS